MREEQRYFSPWIVVYIYAAVIFFISSIPAHLLPSAFAGADKIFHFFEYLPLGFLVCRALIIIGHGHGPGVVFTAILLVIIYALYDEFHQFFVPGREFSFFDMFFDAIGAATGGFLYYGENRRLSQCPL